MPQITDPALQAQLQEDARLGNVPQWSSTDLDQANAFIAYFNALTESTAMELVTHTSYSYKINPPE